jgi:AT-rich DNA-binding protein
MNNKNNHVSISVIRRLPRYYRFLSELNKKGVAKTSSKELSEKMGFTASQIRQDFNCFGGFGQQGYGYNIPHLCSEIERILGINTLHKCILIGAGNLGRTIAAHVPFSNLGFNLIGVFDSNKKLVGNKLADYEIYDYAGIDEFIEKEQPVMAILCVPKDPAETIVSKLYDAGLRSFWNFSHYDISLDYPDTIAENVHLNDSLMTLCFKISDTIDS